VTALAERSTAVWGRRSRRVLDTLDRTRAAAQGLEGLPTAWLEGLHRRVETFSRLTRAVIASHGIEVEVIGNRPPSPSVVMSNHVSYLDPLLLTAHFPAVPIAKSEVEAWPVVGAAAHRFGVIFVHRTRPEQGATVLRRCHRALQAGVSILNFPEGTTSFGETVLPLKRGLFAVAQWTKAPVVPAVLRFDDRDMCWVGDEGFVPHYFRLLGRPVTRARLVFGDPLESDGWDTPEALRDATRWAMLELRRRHFGI
jgi:1-acyl-sn-glycerol-3-phosphate acyltransferase